MPPSLGQCSVMKEISKAEEAIRDCYNRVNTLEAVLESSESEGRDATRKELQEVRKLLATNEKLLADLHKHNRKSFLFAAVLCGTIFTLYMFYLLIFGVG